MYITHQKSCKMLSRKTLSLIHVGRGVHQNLITLMDGTSTGVEIMD